MKSGPSYDQYTVKDYSRILMPISYILTPSHRFVTIVSEMQNRLGMNVQNI